MVVANNQMRPSCGKTREVEQPGPRHRNAAQHNTVGSALAKGGRNTNFQDKIRKQIAIKAQHWNRNRGISKSVSKLCRSCCRISEHVHARAASLLYGHRASLAAQGSACHTQNESGRRENVTDSFIASVNFSLSSPKYTQIPLCANIFRPKQQLSNTNQPKQ